MIRDLRVRTGAHETVLRSLFFLQRAFCLAALLEEKKLLDIFRFLAACIGAKGGENMAAKKTKAATKLILKVQTGTDKKGAPTYGQRMVQHMNPALSDEYFLAVGKGIGGLQSHTVHDVMRQDAAALTEE